MEKLKKQKIYISISQNMRVFDGQISSAVNIDNEITRTVTVIGEDSFNNTIGTMKASGIMANVKRDRNDINGHWEIC